MPGKKISALSFYRVIVVVQYFIDHKTHVKQGKNSSGKFTEALANCTDG
jgi:hypothetical protein